MKIEYLDLCGILFETESVLLIIDGIRSSENAFSAQPARVGSYIEHRLKSFNGKRVMAFTHAHRDHFDDLSMYQLVESGAVDKAVIPYDEELVVKCCGEAENKDKIILLRERLNEPAEFTIGNVKLSFFKTKHLKFEGYDHILNYCIKVTIGREVYLVFGDSDQEGLKKILNQETGRVEGMFITPVILGKPEWVKPLQSNRIRNIYVYHLVSEKDDQFGYRTFAKAKQALYRDSLPNIKLLLEDMRKIIISQKGEKR